MCDILCVTNRSLCREDFFRRLEGIAAAHPAGVILREKDLSPEEYRSFAARAMEICRGHGVPCILHSFVDAALELGAQAIHLPLPLLRGLDEGRKERFAAIGASCHSLEEVREAEALGCSYITAGHIFETDCKRGLPGRGLDFLRAVCRGTSMPVFAIGGISPENMEAVRSAGAAGACIMSGLMQCADAAVYLDQFRKAGDTNAL